MKTRLLHLLVSLSLTAASYASPRTSADYAVVAETLDFGGGRIASADYAIQGSVAVVTGVSAESDPVLTIARHGFIGQLYELLGYGLLATDYYPPEESSSQLIPVRTADDGTNLLVPNSGFTFTPLSGPVSSISPNGLVSTSPVYQDTQAMVGATSPWFDGEIQLLLFVQDTRPDNFGTYAADGLPDAWQITHFGLENPLAAPQLDPDGDGQDNRFEFTAGIIPTDPLSRFLLRIAPVPGEPTHKNLIFSPALSDRTYTVKSSTTLSGGTWEALTDFTDDNQPTERTITDHAAIDPSKFYHIEITKP